MKVSGISVDYVDHMGSDLSVVNAARVSFKKESDWELGEFINEDGGYFPKVLSDKDAKLIRYLASHDHISPFHHTFITLRVKAPVFVARQLVKHEYMPWNEVSRRYVDSEPEFYFPDHWRERASDKKQGSGTRDVSRVYALHEFGKHQHHEFQVGVDTTVGEAAEILTEKALFYYEALKHAGVCPEQARMVLPQNMMTEWYWSGTLSAFAKMLKLRLPEDTQKETREVAEKVRDIIMPLFPASLSALLEEY